MTQERDQKHGHEQSQGKRPNMEGNQGEGNRGAAKAYNDDTKEFAQSGKVREQAEKARRDLEGPNGDELRRAEREGKHHAKGEDPALRKP